jgi:hypothetical protein
VLRGVEHLGRRPGLDDLALPHHDDAVGQPADHPEVVADHDHGRASVAERPQPVDDDALHLGVEGRGRLVRHDQLGPDGEGGGYEGALPQPSRQLARSRAEPRLRVGHPHLGQRLEGSCPSLPRREPRVEAQGVVDLAADRPQRVERDERVLQHEADPGPADATPSRLAEGGEVGVAEREAARRDGPVGEAEQRARRDALARAGLADHGDALAGREDERDTVDDRPGAERDPEVVDHEQGSGGGHGVPPPRRARPRPSTVAAAAVSTTASPGNTVIHQAVVT